MKARRQNEQASLLADTRSPGDAAAVEMKNTTAPGSAATGSNGGRRSSDDAVSAARDIGSEKTPYTNEDIEMQMESPPKWRAVFISAAQASVTWGMYFQSQYVHLRLGISTNDGDRIAAFTAAQSTGFIGKFVALLLQGFIFGDLQPRVRTTFASCMMAVTMSTIYIAFYSTDEPLTTSLVWIAIPYFLTGFARGVGQANLLTYLAPYGKETKSALSFGNVVGYVGFGFVAYFLFEAFPDDPFMHGYVYLLIAIGNGVAVVVLNWFIRDPSTTSNSVIPQESTAQFIANFKEWRLWLPLMRTYTVVFAIIGGFNALTMILIQLMYVRDTTLFPGVTISGNEFMIIYGFLSFPLGAVGAKYGRVFPLAVWAPVILGALGLALMLTSVTALAMIGGSLELAGFAAAGSISTVFIDRHIPRKYNLTAMSAWLLSEAIASVFGVVMSGALRAVVGSGTAEN